MPNFKTKIKGTSLFFSVLCLLVLLSACTTSSSHRQQAEPRSSACVPNFPDQDGWYGADGAYSIELDSNRTLWLFGDTFVSGEMGKKDRVGMDIIMGNTVAVSTCTKDQTFSIRYYLKKNGEFKSSFGEDEVLWPQDPFIVENILYLPMLVVQGVPENQPPYNFRIAGHKIAKIKDFQGNDPHSWQVEYLDWTNALPAGIDALATTSVVYNNHVYFFPLYRQAKDNINISGNILARIAVNQLDKPANHFEFWAGKSQWKKELVPNEAQIIFSAGISEISIRYCQQSRLWRAVFLSPENKGSHLLYSTAPLLEGPWSDPAIILESVPEVTPGNQLYDPNTFCYAGKEHRQFSDNKTLVVTYVCNSSEIDHPKSFIRRNLFLYRPVVKIILP